MGEGKLEKLEGDPEKADSYSRGNTVGLFQNSLRKLPTLTAVPSPKHSEIKFYNQYLQQESSKLT